jgi:alpha-mannosidase
MSDKKIHLICNAHLDPVWLWEWEEGAAAAISTFRTAADLCEEFDSFVFNHNEVLLYQWVEEYEPTLFERIQRLVRTGKWHIMGGWYLQPDCNMPSGESFVRQILLGRRYFQERFGVEPTTAMNVDPFGHTRGLVQIMVKSGYDSYIFCRPGHKDCPLPNDTFAWVGYDGSKIIGKRIWGHYHSSLGGARAKVEQWISEHPDEVIGIVLWGVGNHGGGPSQLDLNDLTMLMTESNEFDIIHSTPESYFTNLHQHQTSSPHHDNDINPWAVGCYTSAIRLKMKHRQLENELYALEKMASTAACQGLIEYPHDEINDALHDLMFAEFHDILPGSSIQPVEETSLRLMDHGLEIIGRLKARVFFTLAQGQPKAAENETPILVYNPHPFPVKTTIACEIQLADQNWEDTFTMPIVYRNGLLVPCQVEKELSNLSLDWRKRVVFDAELEPSQMNRFDCHLEILPQKPPFTQEPQNGYIHFHTKMLDVLINTGTGLIDRYRVHGVDTIQHGAFQPIVILDNEDPWGMLVRSFREIEGKFDLMSSDQGTKFSGVTAGTIPSVRVIEDGQVRTVVEAVFAYGDSEICQQYKLPKQGTEIEIETRVHWNEKNRMLKLAIPTIGQNCRYLGQVAYGIAELPTNGDEAVAQKWVAVISDEDDQALTCINQGTYGSDYSEDGLRLSLLRSPAYSGHPIEGTDRPIVPQDRYLPRLDQGERVFRFWINGGPVDDRLSKIDREALLKNEKPFALSFFPSGSGVKPQPGLILGDDVVQVTAFKQSEDGTGWIIRLFEPTGQARSTILSLPCRSVESKIELSPFEIKTLYLDRQSNTLFETNLMETDG